MKVKKLVVVCFLFAIFGSAIAPASQMNEEIVKIIEQLNAIKPMIHRASQFQDKRERHQVHFYSWTDKDGNKHNGLYEDLNDIKKSLEQVIDAEKYDPEFVEPIKNDYVR